MTEREILLPNRHATKTLGAAIGRELTPSDLFVLSGPLGSGKTFLVRAVCRALGLSPNIRVTSPTFTLVHEYSTVPPVLHADLYRLETPADVAELGLLEQRDQGRALFVEWGEPYMDVLGGDAVIVEFELAPRRARVRATGHSSAARVASLF